MINYKAKEYIARALPNKLTLAETLDKMKSLHKNIAFESKVIADGYDGIFDAEERILRSEVIEYSWGELYYYQECINNGNYLEENPYAC